VAVPALQRGSCRLEGYVVSGVFFVYTGYRFSAVLFALSCFASPLQAKADTFNFSLIGTGISASGTFTAEPTTAAANAESITSLTGKLNNGALTGDPNAVAISLIAAPTIPSTATFVTGPGSNFYFTYDDLLFPNSSTLLDGNGLAFLSTDGVSYNIGFNGSQLV